MSELSKWGQQNLTPAKTSRATQRTAKSVIEKVKLDELELRGDQHLTFTAMDLTVDIDHYRQTVSQGNPELASVLARFELGFVARAERKLNNRNSPFGG